MYSFIFMNVARLLTQTKRKNEVLSDLCDRSTLFLCLCETFLHEGILDSEIKISGFSIIRCDRMARAGGGVCVYVSNSTTYDICLAYSNSVCELLIVRIHNPALIIILMYRPPSCPAEAFNDIISRSQSLILSMPSPLPNIIMLGDFNFPDIDWTKPDLSCTYAIPLLSLSDCFFLNQQVLEPTRKSNILDLIFSPDDFVNSIDVTDSLLSDHRIITVKTSIPFCHTPHQSMNRSCNAFESLDFKKADWSGLCSSIKLVNWQVKLHDCIASDCLSVIIETLSDLCSIHVPPKCYKNKYVSRFHRERKILMRKRTKL